MSRDVKPNNSSLVSNSSDPSKQRQTEVEATSTTTTTLVSSKVEESDEDLFTVPDVETQLPQAAGSSTSTLNNATTDHPITCNSNNNQQQVQPEKRRRGRNPVDKEYRRLKRLLRNRVSAQQARERKKVYMSDLESRAKELQDMNAKLEEKISTLINENTMLRKVLMNTRPKADESKELK